jgi:hypothetical protein
MKIVEIVVSRSQKVNTGNYQSKDFFISLKCEVESCDSTIDSVAAILYNDCAIILENAIEKHGRKKE